MLRCRDFIRQPWLTNSVASQSSSSGCDGGVALRAEVLARLHETAAEELFPGAVHRDARRQRVRLVHEPIGKAQPVRHLIVAQRVQHSGHRRVHLFPLVEEASTTAHERRRTRVRRPLPHHQRRRNGERAHLPLQRREPFPCRFQRRRRPCGERRRDPSAAARCVPRARDRAPAAAAPGSRRSRCGVALAVTDSRNRPIACPTALDRCLRLIRSRVPPGAAMRLLEREDDLTRPALVLAARVDPPPARRIRVARRVLREERVESGAAVVRFRIVLRRSCAARACRGWSERRRQIRSTGSCRTCPGPGRLSAARDPAGPRGGSP